MVANRTSDAQAFDLKEPKLIAILEKLGRRLIEADPENGIETKYWSMD